MKSILMMLLLVATSSSYAENSLQVSDIKTTTDKVQKNNLAPSPIPFKYTFAIEKISNDKTINIVNISGTGLINHPQYYETSTEIPYAKECKLENEKKSEKKKIVCHSDKIITGKFFNLIVNNKNEIDSFAVNFNFKNIELMDFRKLENSYGKIELPSTKQLFMEQSFELKENKNTFVFYYPENKKQQEIAQHKVILTIEK